MLNKRSLPNDVEGGEEAGLKDVPNKLTALMSPRLSMQSSTINRRGTNSLLSEMKSSITPRVFINQAKKVADEEVNE